MAKKITFTAIVSLLSILLVFMIIYCISNAPHQDNQTAGSQTESTTNTETEETTDTTTSETTLETSIPETTTTETESISLQETAESQSSENKNPPPSSTSKPDNTPVQKEELPEWKRMYINYATVLRTKYDHFALVYIDGDDIPELYMYGNDKAELCAFRKDGAAPEKNVLIAQQLNGVGGGNYHKKSGHFLNVCAEDQYLAMYVYELTDVFRQTFYGKEDKSVVPPVYYIGKYTGAVSEAEFKEAVNQYIDTNSIEFLHQNAVTFDAFTEYVTNF